MIWNVCFYAAFPPVPAFQFPGTWPAALPPVLRSARETWVVGPAAGRTPSWMRCQWSGSIPLPAKKVMLKIQPSDMEDLTGQRGGGWVVLVCVRGGGQGRWRGSKGTQIALQSFGTTQTRVLKYLYQQQEVTTLEVHLSCLLWHHNSISTKTRYICASKVRQNWMFICLTHSLWHQICTKHLLRCLCWQSVIKLTVRLSYPFWHHNSTIISPSEVSVRCYNIRCLCWLGVTILDICVG